jgi:hypothetical protein
MAVTTPLGEEALHCWQRYHWVDDFVAFFFVNL